MTTGRINQVARPRSTGWRRTVTSAVA